VACGIWDVAGDVLCPLGTSIIANRPTHETELQSELDHYSTDVYDSSLQNTSTSPKLFAFFKSKKTPSQQHLDTTGSGSTIPGLHGSHQTGFSQSSTITRGMAPPPSQYGSLKANGRHSSTENYGPRGGNGNGLETFERMQQTSYSPNTMLPMRGQRVDGGPTVHGYQGGTEHSSNFSGGPENTYSSFTTAPLDGTMTSSTTYAHGGGVYPDGHATSTAESRRSAMAQSGGQRSFDDRLPILNDRRNSLPSIVKTRADVSSIDARARGTSAASTAAAVTSKSGSKVDPTSKNVVVEQKPQMDTYVIQNGVRKRVRYAVRVKRYLHLFIYLVVFIYSLGFYVS